jgi:transcriptional regulator with XRE-family HTH domain
VAEAAFGVQLRRFRQAAALSLRQLAGRVGYDHSYLSQVERGRRPGSAHLAQLCDRELGTGPALTTAYERSRRAEEPVRSMVGVTTDGDALEAVRHGLVGSFGPGREVDEWRAVTAAYAGEFATTTQAELLPDLTADLQLLRSTASPGSTELTGPAAELSVLIALTLTGLGRIRSAGRWWRTARAAADSSGERRIRSLVRSWEACSGLVERRPLHELLELAEEALTLADDLEQLARALAARAQVLAAMGDAAAAQRAVQGLLVVAGELQPGSTSLFACSQREVFGVEGGVWTTLGEPPAAYEALDRALSLCPPERLRERAELELVLSRCLVVEGEVATGLAVAMRVLVELPDPWHTHPLYDVAGRVLSAVQGEELGRAAVRDYRELLRRRPFDNRTVGSGSSFGRSQG